MDRGGHNHENPNTLRWLDIKGHLWFIQVQSWTQAFDTRMEQEKKKFEYS